MNREIKFRVWNGETMVSPDYITRDGRAHWKENSIPQTSDKLMQYTGLKDQNDVEIYEGDIILAHMREANYPSRYVAVFNEDVAFRMRWEGRFVANEGSFYDEKLSAAPFKRFEVIGNIHENYELLKP